MAGLELEEIYRLEWPRIFATLVRFTGSIELAEDSIQIAFERAASHPDRGLILNPGAWITTVAKRAALDALRRDANLRQKLPLLAGDVEPAAIPHSDSIGGDDRLGLLFVACTPKLEPTTRLAVALRFVGGLPTHEVAAVMLVGSAAMSARLTRAKRQIERDGIRFESPDEVETNGRLDDVLSTVHSMFTVGHTASQGSELGSRLLAQTSIELARALRTIAPADREVAGLLALLLLTHARARARTDDAGRLVTLEHANRSEWDAEMIGEGLDLAAFALTGGGRFALEAGISGLHSQAPDWQSTDWPAICSLYDRLVERWPSPAAMIARVIARSFSDVGAEGALTELDALVAPGVLDRQVVAARADILRRAGRRLEARAAYGLAASMEANDHIRDYYDEQFTQLT